MANGLGAIVCAALPGSVYTASFMRKWKVCPFDVMIKDEEFLHTFTRLGQSDIVSSNVSTTLECYVCALYGQPNLSYLNAARYKIFYKMHTPHPGEKPLEKIKSADLCCLPPGKATPARLPDVLPAGHGWELDGKTLSILWYEGPHTPALVRSK